MFPSHSASPVNNSFEILVGKLAPRHVDSPAVVNLCACVSEGSFNRQIQAADSSLGGVARRGGIGSSDEDEVVNAELICFAPRCEKTFDLPGK